MSYAFVFRAYPDVDHMAPLAWRLLEDGEEVHGIVSPGYDPDNDYRLRFLAGYPRFHLHQVQPRPAGQGWLERRRLAARSLVRRSLFWALWLVFRADISVVGVEWGYGLNDGYERLASPRGVLNVSRSLAGSILRARDPFQTRANFMVAARLLGRATVCLPHGLSVKVGRGARGQEPLGASQDWRDRNRFTAYVFNTEHQRKWFLENAQGDPSVMQTWGSLRWAPEWVEVNARLAPAFSWPGDRVNGWDGHGPRLKVIFMVPKWKNHVDKDATLALVRRLQSLEEISLAVKGHPRPKNGSADPLRDDPDIDWERIHDISGADSVSAIAAADVVIDVGSSIGIEVVMQGKVLVNPTYLHDFWTLFDEIEGSCVVAHCADDVVDYLRQHARGEPWRITDSAHRELMRRSVFGSQPEPFDVLGTYSQRVRALAGASTQTRS